MYRQDSFEPITSRAHRETSIDLMTRMERSAGRAANRLLAPHGLTSPQATMLSALHRHGPELALPELASITEFPLAAVTSIMDRLLVRGLVSRSGHPLHGQWVVAALTPTGIEIVEALDNAREALLERLVDSLAGDELAVLARIAERLEDEATREIPHPPTRADNAEPSAPPILRLIRGERE
jgi:DNA-binding MarR family transcriptional regulator